MDRVFMVVIEDATNDWMLESRIHDAVGDMLIDRYDRGPTWIPTVHTKEFVEDPPDDDDVHDAINMSV